MIEANVYGLLVGSAEVTDLVEDRIHPLVLPQGTDPDATPSGLPAIRYERLSTLRRVALEGVTGPDEAEFMVDAFAADYDAAEALADAIENALTGRGTASGADDVVLVMLPDGRAPEYEAEIKLWRVRTLWKVPCKERRVAA